MAVLVERIVDGAMLHISKSLEQVKGHAEQRVRTHLGKRPKIRRFHFTCLTCSDRRHYFKTWRSKHLKEYKKIIMVMEPAAGRRFFLPERYMSYGIIIPVNERGLVNPLKAGFVKVLMTIAERIAEF